MPDYVQLRDGLRRLFGQQDFSPEGEDCEACGDRMASACDSCGQEDQFPIAPEPGPVQPALLAVGPDDEVLDLSGDGGPEARAAALRTGPGGGVVSLEGDDQDIIRARLDTARSGEANVKFLQGRPDDIPAGEGVFDLVTANCALGFLKRPGPALFEAARVLKQGGRLSILEPVSLGSGCAGLQAPTEGQWLSLLAQAGFQDLEIGYLADGPDVMAAWSGSEDCRQGMTLALIEGRKNT